MPLPTFAQLLERDAFWPLTPCKEVLNQLALLRWRSDGERHWLRVDARDADGRLLGNQLYVNWPR